MLESYCNWLENRVISWFDAAVAENNLVLQGQCAAIMRQLDKEKSITQVGGSCLQHRCCATPSCTLQDTGLFTMSRSHAWY